MIGYQPWNIIGNLKMIVQIYEIQTPKEAERCIEVGVDHVGSVLLPKEEWQNQTLRETLGVSDGTPVKNTLIPLFREMDMLFKILDYYRPDFVHFCESLTVGHGKKIELDPYVEAQSRIKEKFPEVGIMRSIPIPPKNFAPGFPTLEVAGKLEPVTDLFLTDTWLKNEPVEGFIGITGKPCNWKIAKDLILQSKIPVILAGGLSPENVYAALMEVAPAGADSCTQTNRKDKDGNTLRFKKDFERVKQFVQEVRRAEKGSRPNRGSSMGF
jgi:phosphoribosylanthranilate isomerase